MEERIENDIEILDLGDQETIILLEEMGGIHLGGMWDGKSCEFCWNEL